MSAHIERTEDNGIVLLDFTPIANPNPHTLKDGTVLTFKHIKLEDMKAYMEQFTSADELPIVKQWFKTIAYKGDKYNHLGAVREFCNQYCPELIPVAKPVEPKKSASLLDW